MSTTEILHQVSAFLDNLGRSTIRLADEWDDDEFRKVKDLVDDYLYPDLDPDRLDSEGYAVTNGGVRILVAGKPIKFVNGVEAE